MCVWVWVRHCLRAGRVYLLDQVPRQGLLADGLLSQGEPELTGLQRNVLIRVLCALQHVLVGERYRHSSVRGWDWLMGYDSVGRADR